MSVPRRARRRRPRRRSTSSWRASGAFRCWVAAKVLWVGCGAGREALVALAEALSAALESRGFASDARPFSPHLTLARARNRSGSSAVAAAVRRSAAAVGTLGRVRVDRLLLVQSTLGSGPPRHDVLGTFPLGR